MFERFTRASKRVVEQAQALARDEGSQTIEAEHLLLALSGDGGEAGSVLRAAGLDADGVRNAVDAALERDLEAAGVDLGLMAATSTATAVRAPRFAASAKLALERSMQIAVGRGDRRLLPGHVLLGLLQADVGLVPRALRGAGVDRSALRAATEKAL